MVEVTCWRCGRRHVELGTICPTHGRLQPGFCRQVLPARRRSRPGAAIVVLVFATLVGGAASLLQHVIEVGERPDPQVLERLEPVRAELHRMLEAPRAAPERPAADRPAREHTRFDDLRWYGAEEGR